MKSQLYLDKYRRMQYVKDLTKITELYFERIQPIFSGIKKEAEEYENKLWENFMSRPCYDESDYIDPSDVADKVQEAGIERYELLSLMKYRNLSMWISCLCQVWEQQMFSFIYHEAQSQGIEYNAADLKRGFVFSKEIFDWHQQPFEDLMCWTKIKELRTLVNVIKHAEGDSEKNLRQTRPDYFVKDTGAGKFDLISLYHSTLLEPTLQISDNDFNDYYCALVNFWKELPERMYLKEAL